MGNLFKNLKPKQIFLALIILPCLFLMSACNNAVDFKINFVVDGIVYDTIETQGNTTISMPDDPEKQGYTFDGWYWDKDVWSEPFTANSLLNIPLKKDMNVYAKFTFVHNHTMQHVDYLAPTCVASGNIEYYHCTSCGENYSDSLGQSILSNVLLDSLGHIKGSYVETKQSTCTEMGTEVSSCTRCHEVLDTRDIPATGHTPSNWTVLTPATCTSDGVSIQTCNVCLDELDRKAIPSTGHKFGTWFTQKYATYYETGIEKRNCTKCSHYETRDIPKIVADIDVPTSISVEFGIIKWDGYSPFGFDVVVNGISQVVKSNQLETELKSDDYNEVKVASIDVDGNKSEYVELKDFIVNAPISNLHYVDDGSNVTFTWDSPNDLYDYTFIVGENENTVDKAKHSYTVARSSLASGSVVSIYVQGLDSANFYPSKKIIITLQQLDAPNLSIDKLNIKWNEISGADNYKVKALTTETITSTTYSYDGASAGEHTITVTAFGRDCLNNSTTLTFNKLTYPEVTIENNIVTWNAIAGQVRYATLINDIETKFIGNSYTITNTQDTYDIYLYASPVQPNTMQSDRVIISKFTYGEFSNVYYGMFINTTPTYTKVVYDNYIYVPAQFMNNINLSNVTSSVTLIANKLPTGLSKTLVTNIIIPDVTTEIVESAFSGCTKALSVSVPESVISIGDDAFYNCSSLIGVYITDLDKWVSIEFGNYCANPLCYAKNLYLNGTLVTDAILTSATKISAYAFYEYTKLTSITIPESVISIGDSAFFNCTSLKTVTFAKNSKCERIGNDAFRGCSSLIEMTIPFVGGSASATSASSSTLFGYIFGTSSYNGGTNIRQYYTSYFGDYISYYIPSSLKKVTILGGNILYGAFYNCSMLTEIAILDGVTSIGDYAFNDCTSLTGVYTTNLDKWASIEFGNYCANPLYYAKNLYLNGTLVTDATLANTTKISSYAFAYCTSLKSITIPESVTSIGYNAFDDCTSLTGVYITNLDKWVSINFGSYYANPLYYAGNLYLNGSLVTDATLTSATKISSYAFYGYDKLTSITIPQSVTSIGYDAFYNCTSLTGVYITNLDKWVSIDFGYCANPLSYAKNLYLNGELITDATVTRISSYAFYGCTSIISITISASVTSIGSEAFYNCTSLTSIVIPESVTSIGSEAFANCTGLVEINYNAISCADLESDNYVFYKAGQSGDGITVNIGANVEKIPAYLFYPCSSSGCSPKITSVVFAENSRCESIGSFAFYGCTSLTGVYITDLDKWASIEFGSGASSPLYNLYLNGELVTDATISNVAEISSYAFHSCTSLTSITISAGVTSIGSEAFCNCTSLTSITIPESVISIAYDAFSNCTALTNIVVNEKNVTYDSRDNCNAIIKTASNTLIIGCQGTSIPSTVTTIGPYAFYYCTSLTSITIPESVTNIGSSAFRGCSALVEMTLPFVGGSASATSASSSTVFGYIFGTVSYAGGTSTKQHYYSTYNSYETYCIPSSLRKVTILGGNILYGAFYNCSMLTEITILDGVTSIGDCAFSGCSSLIEMTLPFVGGSASATNDSSSTVFGYIFGTGSYIGGEKTEQYYANGFYKAYYIPSSLRKVTILGGNILYRAFVECSMLTEIVIPESVTSIGMSAFSNCTGLKTVIFSGNSKCDSIGGYAFDGCTSLTSIAIPESVTSIRVGVFRDCTSLTSITIPENVTSIESDAFDNCTGLEIVTFAENSKCESIGVAAFYNCISLTSITIPESVTSIDGSAFDECTSLIRVYYGGGVDDWSDITIGSYNSNLTNATRYYYSEEEPTIDGNYWHYVDGMVTEWKKEE